MGLNGSLNATLKMHYNPSRGPEYLQNPVYAALLGEEL
jgi:hypothetical protein